MTRVLVTTTSLQDTPGPHHDKLAAAGLELVRERGPLPESRMLELAGSFDAFLCGDDAITRAVIEKSLPRLRIIAKYGIGVDKIDVKTATEKGIPITFTPGVNHTTVAEHCFGLMLCLSKHFVDEINFTRAGKWKRLTGHELFGKTLGIVGLGRIGKEMAIRARAFGMPCIGYDLHWDEKFAAANAVRRAIHLEDLLKEADVVSLHTNLTPDTNEMINPRSLGIMKKGAMLINCGRGELVNNAAILAALQSGQLGGYGADVLDVEPPPADHPLLKVSAQDQDTTVLNCIITPHVASRTYESVQRQAGMAVDNLLLALRGEKPLAQVNQVPIPMPR
ncbi:MAG TPA: phosphoglycerate dehydrogenase [Opitutales bacterium]|nr:phosphoglycerate dehydrogenase [Opitutales bacterium]